MADRTRSHYEELDVVPSASAKEIRSSYLILARRHHPDRMGAADPAVQARSAARMARINVAWNVLSDPDRRARYDAAARGDSIGSHGGAVRDPGDTFQPFTEVPDEIDPRLVDDTETGARTLHRSLTFIPAGLAIVGLTLCILGAMLGFLAMLGAGLAALAGSAISFLLVPLIALANASRADRVH